MAISPLLDIFEQREQRKKALADTRAWLRIEGLGISEEAEPLFQDYVDGKLDFDGLLEGLRRVHRLA